MYGDTLCAYLCIVFVLFCNPLFNYQTEPTDIRNPVLQAVCNTLYVTWIYISIASRVSHTPLRLLIIFGQSLSDLQDIKIVHVHITTNSETQLELVAVMRQNNFKMALDSAKF